MVCEQQAPGFRERASLASALRHFNPYLVGKEFLIRTDHKPNLSIVKGKTKVYDTLTDEILLYLPFRMEYLNGSKMFADVLSRPRFGNWQRQRKCKLGNLPPYIFHFPPQIQRSRQTTATTDQAEEEG